MVPSLDSYTMNFLCYFKEIVLPCAKRQCVIAVKGAGEGGEITHQVAAVNEIMSILSNYFVFQSYVVFVPDIYFARYFYFTILKICGFAKTVLS